MAEKNHGKWTNRPAVQKAFDADPQHAYNAVNSVITREQAAELEALLVPPPSNEEVLATLTALKGAMEQHGIDTKAVDEKIASLGAGLDSHHNS